MGELTVLERAKKALQGVTTETQLKQLATKYSDIMEINSDADYALVRSSQGEIRNARVTIEKAGKAARDDANAFSKAVISEQKRLIGIIQPEEDRLKALRQAVDDEKKRREEEAAAKEQARIAGIQSLIDTIKGMIPRIGAPSGSIKECINWLNKEPVDSRYGEYTEEAETAIMDSLRICTERLKEQEAYEEEKERLKAERAEQAAEAAKLAEERAKIEEEKRKAEAEARKEREAIAAERRAIEEAKLRDRLEREAKERAEREAKERAEKEAAAKAEREKREAEKRERIEKEKPEIQKLRDFADHLRSITPPAVPGVKFKNAISDAMLKLAQAVEDLDLFCHKMEQ